jgi:hypothetical protein
MKSLALMATGVCFCFSTSILCAATYSGGSGTAENPYRISTITDWQTLKATPGDWNNSFILTSNLNLQGIELAPVGTSGIGFGGSFNGNGNVIYNATINSVGSKVGLFGMLNDGGVIYNLGLESAVMTGKTYVGALVGYNNGTVYNCYATGTANSTSTTAATYVGGLAGYNEDPGSISNCYAMAAATGTYTTSYVGGLVGYNYYGVISDCYSTGGETGGSYMGGVLGRNYGSDVTNCFWDTETSGRSTGIGRDSGGVVVFGLNTAGMKQRSSFTSAGWDFVGEIINGDIDAWRMCVDSVDYPRLNCGYIKNGDFVCSNGVDADDLLVLSQDWLLTYTAALSGADANGDKTVDLKDFNILASYWLGM